MKKNISKLLRTICILLILSFVLPIPSYAATDQIAQPRASYYLSEYSSYVYPAGSGKIQVYYEVHGTNYMDELGCISVSIYESTDNVNWTWKKTYSHDSTSGMLGYNVYYHGGHVDYQGVAGRYYKAYVCIWGGDNGAGDTRYFWTSSKKAT